MVWWWEWLNKEKTMFGNRGLLEFKCVYVRRESEWWKKIQFLILQMLHIQSFLYSISDYWSSAILLLKINSILFTRTRLPVFYTYLTALQCNLQILTMFYIPVKSMYWAASGYKHLYQKVYTRKYLSPLR